MGIGWVCWEEQEEGGEEEKIEATQGGEGWGDVVSVEAVAQMYFLWEGDEE